MERPSFSEALRAGVLIFDGAIGTEIYRRHVFTNRSFDELCLSDPQLIRQIHADYREAGADVLTTNTYAANRAALERYGLGHQSGAIARAGARIARQVAEAADRAVYVAGSIGPLPSQVQYEAIFESMVVEQVEGLLEGGADFILFETQPDRKALVRCAAAMRRFPDIPFVFSFALLDQGESATGEPVEGLLQPLDGSPMPIAWGMNCGTGPDGLLGPLERAVRLTSLPLVVQPNAGVPKEVEHRRIYYCSPEYLTSYARRYVDLGAAAVGGCCGTTPDHIREMARAIKPLARARVKPVALEPGPETRPKEPTPFAEKSRFAWRLAHGQWVTTVELLPPRGYDLGETVAKSKILHRHGVDAINIPDGPRATSRISPLVTAQRIQQEAMIEVILHFCCRDRNLIGMQADLLACAACEIRNILFVTGDPPKLGNYPHATGVFDADSIGMVAVQKRLNTGIDLGGQAIDPQTHAAIGVGLDPTALDEARELERFQRKVEAGAEFAITQPVFDPEALLRFLDKVQHHDIAIVAGIWPLASYRNALFMKNEVPGVVIPDWIMERMASVSSREDQLKMGIDIARQSVARIRHLVRCIQVSAPLGRVANALAVIEA